MKKLTKNDLQNLRKGVIITESKKFGNGNDSKLIVENINVKTSMGNELIELVLKNLSNRKKSKITIGNNITNEGDRITGASSSYEVYEYFIEDSE